VGGGGGGWGGGGGGGGGGAVGGFWLPVRVFAAGQQLTASRCAFFGIWAPTVAVPPLPQSLATAVHRCPLRCIEPCVWAPTKGSEETAAVRFQPGATQTAARGVHGVRECRLRFPGSRFALGVRRDAPPGMHAMLSPCPVPPPRRDGRREGAPAGRLCCVRGAVVWGGSEVVVTLVLCLLGCRVLPRTRDAAARVSEFYTPLSSAPPPPIPIFHLFAVALVF
jgi:hypothetical protein